MLIDLPEYLLAELWLMARSTRAAFLIFNRFTFRGSPFSDKEFSTKE
jgi:hypothetical protein